MVTKLRRPDTRQPRGWEAYTAQRNDDPVARGVPVAELGLRPSIASQGAAVLLAVATGTSLNPVREKRAQRASWTERCLRVVIVTDNPNWLDARLQLAETVFGPAFSEFGHLPQYETWSVDRFMAERTANTPAWRSLGAGVLLAGSLEEAFR